MDPSCKILDDIISEDLAHALQNPLEILDRAKMAPREGWTSEEAKEGFFESLERNQHLLDDIPGVGGAKDAEKEEKKAPISSSRYGAILESILTHRPPSDPADVLPHGEIADVKAAHQKIIDLTSEILSAMRAKRETRITLERGTTYYFWNTVTDRPDRETKITRQNYMWPGKDDKAGWKFAQIYRILQEILYCITTGVSLTVRDLFYRAPKLHEKQENVCDIVEALAFTLRVKREDLHIHGGTRGLVAGLPHYSASGPVVTPGGIECVPFVDMSGNTWDFTNVNWILVVEHEATFMSLAKQKFHSECVLGPGIMVTGKGYPDVATRQFLHDIVALWRNTSTRNKDKPIYGLFDCNPDGMNIFKTYQQGSENFAHDTTMRVPDMQYLGVKMTELVELIGTDATTSYIKLSNKDRKLARKIFAMASDGRIVFKTFQNVVKEEMTLMLKLGLKAEMQILEELSGGLIGWLNNKIKNEAYTAAEELKDTYYEQIMDACAKYSIEARTSQCTCHKNRDKCDATAHAA